MTKAELIGQMAEDSGLTKKEADAVLASIIDGIKGALKKKEGKITLPGFGTFSKVRRKARKGINPRTGEAIKIAARNAVKFQPSKALKEGV